jgi:hypothetical protein
MVKMQSASYVLWNAVAQHGIIDTSGSASYKGYWGYIHALTKAKLLGTEELFLTALTGNGYVILKWKSEKKVSYWEVFRSTREKSGYVSIAKLNATQNTYRDESVENGKIYFYKVKGEAGNNDVWLGPLKVRVGLNSTIIPYSLYFLPPEVNKGKIIFKFGIPEGKSDVTLKVYKADGRLIGRVFYGKKPGHYRIEWKFDKSKGVYFAVLERGRKKIKHKFVVVK